MGQLLMGTHSASFSYQIQRKDKNWFRPVSFDSKMEDSGGKTIKTNDLPKIDSLQFSWGPVK